MYLRSVMATTIVAVCALGASDAHAQAAAEEAVILSGTGSATGKASSNLGGAVSRSIGGATKRVRAIPRSAPRRGPHRVRGGAVIVAGPLAADSDPLENTDAPAYQLSNGATIRVSGGMRNSSAARCKLNCSEKRQSAKDKAPVAPTEETDETETEISDARSEGETSDQN